MDNIIRNEPIKVAKCLKMGTHVSHVYKRQLMKIMVITILKVIDVSFCCCSSLCKFSRIHIFSIFLTRCLFTFLCCISFFVLFYYTTIVLQFEKKKKRSTNLWWGVLQGDKVMCNLQRGVNQIKIVTRLDWMRERLARETVRD